MEKDLIQGGAALQRCIRRRKGRGFSRWGTCTAFAQSQWQLRKKALGN